MYLLSHAWVCPTNLPNICSTFHWQIADLNLRAGKLSILTSSFHSAAEYFMNGIALLPDECFEHQYNLSVELHNAAQGALFATGDFTMMNSLSSKVLTNACCFDDKIFSCERSRRLLAPRSLSNFSYSSLVAHMPFTPCPISKFTRQ